MATSHPIKPLSHQNIEWKQALLACPIIHSYPFFIFSFLNYSCRIGTSWIYTFLHYSSCVQCQAPLLRNVLNIFMIITKQWFSVCGVLIGWDLRATLSFSGPIGPSFSTCIDDFAIVKILIPYQNLKKHPMKFLKCFSKIRNIF